MGAHLTDFLGGSVSASYAQGMVSSARPAVPEPGPMKCFRCAQEIADDAPVVFEHGDLFHRACWLVVTSDARVANARQIATLAVERLKRGWQRAKDERPQA